MLLKVLIQKTKRIVLFEDGQSFVQMVLVLPVLLVLVGFVLDGARIIGTKILLNGAASESVRYIVEMSNGGLDSRVISEAIKIGKENSRLNSDKLIIEISPGSVIQKNYVYKSSASNKYKKYNDKYKVQDVTVYLEYKVSIIFPFAKQIFGKDEVLVSNSFTTRIGVK